MLTATMSRPYDGAIIELYVILSSLLIERQIMSIMQYR